MQQDPSSQAYAEEVARLRASESDSDAELLVRFDIFSNIHILHQGKHHITDSEAL